VTRYADEAVFFAGVLAAFVMGLLAGIVVG
jgi:hypothetical protein